jgi:Glycosyltransferase family 17
VIFDTFMFAGEADMLYFRLEHLAGRVDRHVIVEADQTHRGVPRQPWIPHHLQCCLAPYKDRITYVPVHFPDPEMEPWDREHFQRDRLWVGLASKGNLSPDDKVIIADVDEIPSDEALAYVLDKPPRAVSLRMRTFHSAVDWEYLNPELATVIVKAGCLSWPVGTLSKIRDSRYSLPVVEDGGWHFSWVGTQDDRVRKLEERSCHNGDMGETEAAAIRTGATYQRGQHAAEMVKAVEVDESFPPYIQAHACPKSWFRPR